MPFYEYECEVCLEKFERITSMGNRYDVIHCSQKARLLVSLSSFVRIEPIHILQEHSAAEGGGYTEVGKINNAPRTEPARPHSENLIAV